MTYPYRPNLEIPIFKRKDFQDAPIYSVPDDWTGFTTAQQGYFRAWVEYFRLVPLEHNGISVPLGMDLLWKRALRSSQRKKNFVKENDLVYQLSHHPPVGWAKILAEFIGGVRVARWSLAVDGTQHQQQGAQAGVGVHVQMHRSGSKNLAMLLQPHPGAPGQNSAANRSRNPIPLGSAAATYIAQELTVRCPNLAASDCIASVPGPVSRHDSGKRQADDQLGDYEYVRKIAKPSTIHNEVSSSLEPTAGTERPVVEEVDDFMEMSITSVMDVIGKGGDCEEWDGSGNFEDVTAEQSQQQALSEDLPLAPAIETAEEVMRRDQEKQDDIRAFKAFDIFKED